MFLSGGGMGPDTGHNGRINHHKLIPESLRAGIEISYTDDLNDMNPQTLGGYEAVIMYRSMTNGKNEWVDALVGYVENGGGLVALHNTCGAFGGSPKFISDWGSVCQAWEGLVQGDARQRSGRLAQAPDMFFLKDTDSDDRADVVKKINSGWGTGDKHGGPSNLRYGLDNRIYGCVGGGGHWDERGRFSAEQVWVGNTVVLFSDDHLRLQRDKDR